MLKIDAKEYDVIARGVFAPVYPVIAQQIVAHTGVASGTCVDIGCGGGYLGAALARISDLFVHFIDQSADMIALAERTIAGHDLQSRTAARQGDVTDIDLPDACVDLVVSRGSVFFWEDLPRAFKEIYRILAPQGWAYIGGGFGSRELKESIEREMASRGKSTGPFGDKVRRNLGPETRNRFVTALETAGIDSYSILQSDDIGLWLVMRK
jgi:ubiquinone/menaquinone biosynthesis C-methylase UbiE